MPRHSKAQVDTVHYPDGKSIPFRTVLASGYNMPALWFSVSFLQADFMAMTKKSSLFVLGGHHAPYQHFSSAYCEYGFTLFRTRAERNSGKVGLAEEAVNYGTRIYSVRFSGLEAVTRYGLHIGVQQSHYNRQTWSGSEKIRGSGGVVDCKLEGTSEIDFGFFALSRRGVIVDPGSCRGRFYMMRMSLDAVLYRITKFGVLQTDSGGTVARYKAYSYNESDPQGLWEFSDLPYETIGMKMNFEFFWSGSSWKNNEEHMRGWHARVGMQYVPESVLGNIVLTTSLGLAFGSAPRLNLLRDYNADYYIPTPQAESRTKAGKG